MNDRSEIGSSRITLAEIIEIEPRVGELILKCKNLPDGLCANSSWYEADFKGSLVKLVGWGSANPRLKTPQAYDVAYDACQSALPDCGNSRCFNCGKPLPEALSFKGKHPAQPRPASGNAALSWIAAIDMLGYSNTVLLGDETGTTDAVLAELRRIVSETYPYLGGDPTLYPPSFASEMNWKVKTYADNVLVNVPTDDNTFFRLWWLCSSLSEFQMAMVLHGQLVRGGLTIGMNCVDDDIAFGGGLIEAHVIESEIAKQPRIVISPRTRRFEAFMISQSGGVISPSSTPFMVDHDGMWFVDYLSFFNARTGQAFDPGALNRHRAAVIELRDKFGNVPKLSSKYDWLVRYHDAACASAGATDIMIGGTVDEYPRVINNADIQKEVDSFLKSGGSEFADEYDALETIMRSVRIVDSMKSAQRPRP